MKGLIAAQRYAKALLSYALESKAEEAYLTDITTIYDTCETSRDLQLLLSSPIVKKEKKQNVLHALFGDKVQKATLLFLDLITKHGRENILHTICHQFIALYEKQKGIVHVNLTSASEVSATNEENVINKIDKNMLGAKELRVHKSVDADLIGGFVLDVEGYRYDLSVRKALNDVRKQLQQ